MAYLEDQLRIVVTSSVDEGQTTWRYQSDTDTLAEIKGSDYFSSIPNGTSKSVLMKPKDIINLIASDGVESVTVTGFDPITVAPSAAGSVTLADGAVGVGNPSNQLAATTGTPAQIIQFDSSSKAVAASVTGDVTLDSSGIASLLPGTPGQILHYNSSSDAASVTISGDITLDDSGTATIANKVLTGDNCQNTAASDTRGGIVLVFQINTGGGITQDYDIVVDNQIQVFGAEVILSGGPGTAMDTIRIKNGATDVSDLIDISTGTINEIFRTSAIDLGQGLIPAAGTLRVSQVDGGGSDCPPVTVRIFATNN